MPLVPANVGNPAVSIIVPSYNSTDTITHCLDALYRQDCEEEYEILVVDSSDDGTDCILTDRYPEIRLLRFPQRTLPGRARNRGARESRGKILLFTDADCIAPHDWLQKHLARQQTWDVVGGSVDNANPDSLIGWASYLLEFSRFTPSRKCVLARNLVTANVSYKKSVFPQGGFPEDIWPGEDRLFHWNLSASMPICFDAAIMVYHLNRSRLRDFLSHQARLGAMAVWAWRRIDVDDKLMLNHPVLSFLTPFYRSLVMPWRMLRHTPRFCLPAVIAAPLIFLGSSRWAFSFFYTARSLEETEVGKKTGR